MGQNQNKNDSSDNRKPSPKKQTTSSPKRERISSPQKERIPSPQKEIIPSPKKETGPSFMRQVGSTILDFAPGISSIKSAQEAITGENYITGEKLSTQERLISGASVFLPLIKTGKNVINTTAKIAKNVNKTNKIIEGEKNILKSEKAINNIGRRGAKHEGLRKHDIPTSQQPDKSVYNHHLKYENGNPQKKREDWTGTKRTETYKDRNNPNREVIVREDVGHEFIKDGKVERIDKHFNFEVREEGKPTIKDKKHYYFNTTKKQEKQSPNTVKNENI